MCHITSNAYLYQVKLGMILARRGEKDSRFSWVILLYSGGWNLTEELTDRTNRLIEISNKKVDNYRYKRIYFKSIKLSQDDYEQSLRNATKTLIKNALEEEKKLIAAAISLSES